MASQRHKRESASPSKQLISDKLHRQAGVQGRGLRCHWPPRRRAPPPVTHLHEVLGSQENPLDGIAGAVCIATAPHIKHVGHEGGVGQETEHMGLTMSLASMSTRFLPQRGAWPHSGDRWAQQGGAVCSHPAL